MPRYKNAQDYIRANSIENSNGCWIWQLSVNANGYGTATFHGKTTRSHRLAYMAFAGEIPDQFHVHHKCEVRNCCNPKHLEAVNPRKHIQLTPKCSAYYAVAFDRCKNGHADLVMTSKGYRECRTCKLSSNSLRFDYQPPKCRGVYFKRTTGRWTAKLYYRYKDYWGGTFDTAEEALVAFRKLEASVKNSPSP